MKETVIYALLDPRDKAVKYVGKTVNYKNRMKSHRCAQGKHRCGAWLRRLKDRGLRCDSIILETVVGDSWAIRERYWIEHYREMGADLCNLSNGGEGVEGRKLSAESCEKLRQAFKGRPIPQEQRERISATLTGKVQSPETVAKRLATINERRSSKGLPPLGTYRERHNHRRKKDRRSLGATEKFSPEWKAKIAEGMKRAHANMTDEEKERQRQMRIGKPAHNKGMKYGSQSPERRARQSEKMKAFLSELTPEQRQNRMAAARAARKGVIP